ncbi:MAG TPA: MATE family efflux transporter [Prolixibacteraceae bacterium]|nr:MATE family efflux transporter [Prolixibacteraceae bacterium]
MITDFTTTPLPRLIRSIALPSSIGFIFNTLFNVVDTYYGGLVSTTALAALSLSFPVFFIILSIGVGMGTGTTALISSSLGAGDIKKAGNYAAQAITLSFFNALPLTLLGIIFSPHLLTLLGATDEYLGIAVAYMNVILSGTFFFLLNSSLNAALNSRGDTKTYRNFLIVGFFLNVGMDPWFLYGGFGLPAMGVIGIGLSTVLIQMFGSIYLIYRIRKRKIMDGIVWQDFIPQKKPVIDLFKQGFPASLNMLTVAIGIFVITYFASKFGKEAVAAYGIATRIEQLALLPTIGLNIAALTIAAQNSGAGIPRRVFDSWKLNITYGLMIIMIGVIGVRIFSGQLMRIFTSDPNVILIGKEYLNIATLFFFAYVFLNISVSTLQGIKKPMYAIFVGTYRQFLLPLPLFMLLSVYLDWGTKGIWWGIFFANWSAAIFTFFYTRRKLQKMQAPVKSD